MSAAVTLAVVADIHHGPDVGTERGQAVRGLFQGFAAAVGAAAPAAVVDLGDRISDVEPGIDGVRMAEVGGWFQALGRPVWHVNGNHDLVNLTRADNARRLGASLDHATAEVGAWRLIFWRPDLVYRAGRGFEVTAADLDWLEAAVAAGDRPTALFSHAPLLEPDLAGNPYFEADPLAATFAHRERIEGIVAARRGPLLCVAGHVHADSLRLVDGAAQLTLQSLCESYPTPPAATGAFALLELAQGVRWSVAGRAPLSRAFDLAGRSITVRAGG